MLADALDIPYGARVSPGAAGFLVEAAAHVSYARAARLLARHGSRVRATTVMRCMREAGALCAEEDRSAAESLYGAGVVPEAELSAEEICMESDGTWFSLQRRVSVNIVFTIFANVFSPIAPTRFRRIRQRGCAAFGA